MNILFIVPYPEGKAPSQRFRFEQYLPFLKEKGWNYTLAPFLDNATWTILYKQGYTLKKAAGVLTGFLRRLFLLFNLGKYDFVFIHREAAPLGPPVFEYIITKVLKKKVIYDFDDAIWMEDSAGNNKIVSGIKWYDKVKSICRWAYKISAGNTYLSNFALQFNKQVILNPTTIDTLNLHNEVKDQDTKRIVIGWTGTHTTLRHLAIVTPVIAALEKKYDFDFCVISNAAPELPLRSLKFKPWKKETEIEDLLSFNIGLMPLEDDAWAKGKCAFKALQYMALGIPAIVSPVGMNSEVVDNGKNGFICNTEAEWYNAIETLLTQPEVRRSQGKAARGKIIDNYSVLANQQNFLKLFS
ncbi:glycosyltransferase [Adhaeribacter terreus]|uniref:Glycosyltransferase n=1 Tax=Adhaeribacter terreus TaxID=529703 RepID=A0ABW0E813_9BACT